MATIVKRGNAYQFKAYGMDIYGQPCRKTMTWTPPSDKTPKQAAKAAERAAAIFEEECKQGRVVDGTMSLSDYYHRQWSETRAVNLAPCTVKWYNDLFKRVDAHQLGKTPLKAINAHMSNTFYRYLREKCKKTPPKKRKPDAEDRTPERIHPQFLPSHAVLHPYRGCP